jgi:uncharacterized protein YdeI (YjbR/CyaY-like superfamily)
MGTKDQRIDAYIANAQPFARPILEHLRKLFHQGCPDLEETMKWSMPHFDYKGEMMVGMCAFKAHCGFGFWKASLLFATDDKSPEAIGQFGRITSLKDLPSDAKIVRLVKAAAKLNADGIKVARPTTKRAALPVPPELAKALAKKAKAKSGFDALAPGQRREYIAWILEAKREETRAQRIAKTVAQSAEGKTLYWEMRAKAKAPR